MNEEHVYRFTLSEKEIKAIDTFKKEHVYCTKGLSMPFTYIFTPEGDITNIDIKCNGCNHELDVTDPDARY